jgi:hypothetical protein
MLSLLMIIDDLHVPRVSLIPSEADAPLIVDANAMLAGPVPLKGFKMIPRWPGQILQATGTVEIEQLSPNLAFDG